MLNRNQETLRDALLAKDNLGIKDFEAILGIQIQHGRRTGEGSYDSTSQKSSHAGSF